MPGPLAASCGQLLVVGLAGETLGDTERRAFARGERGGVVLFKRNAEAGVRKIAELTRAVREASSTSTPPLVAIDQEGGRVIRIGPPALALPSMQTIGELGDVDLARRLAEAQARELAALGITMNFAPVADTHTRPDNPVIGNRAFSSAAEDVTRFARAWAQGLERGGVLACAKHFPGHGDTTKDSHLELPHVNRTRADLERIEIAPFRALAKEPSVSAMMVSHVVYTALDDAHPASLSPAVGTTLLRTELGFEGVLFTDDLEMKAIQLPMGEAVVLAISAGCDALLVCHREDLAEEALAALVREAESSPAFRARCEEAHRRFTAMRSKLPPRPVEASDAALAGVFDASRLVAAELATRTGRSA